MSILIEIINIWRNPALPISSNYWKFQRIQFCSNDRNNIHDDMWQRSRSILLAGADISVREYSGEIRFHRPPVNVFRGSSCGIDRDSRSVTGLVRNERVTRITALPVAAAGRREVLPPLRSTCATLPATCLHVTSTHTSLT